MKDLLTDANFPRTADQRVYHLGLRPGEVANRIITVGSPSRAECISKFLDVNPEPFILSSERGFLTITGRYKGTPVSIVSIGMGSPNMDFFVREVRECIIGDMCIIRLGSCGALGDAPVGTVVVPKSCVSISRNIDFDFLNPEECAEPPYRFSKQVHADNLLHLEVQRALESTAAYHNATSNQILAGTVNASADSFYSSQGRQTSFPDQNSDLLANLRAAIPNVATLEMETFHLYHLAACWRGWRSDKKEAPPLTTRPVGPAASAPSAPILTARSPIASPDPAIRVAAAQIVFASRTSQDFITPERVVELERWTGQSMLEALRNIKISEEQLHPEPRSVWEILVN